MTDHEPLQVLPSCLKISLCCFVGSRFVIQSDYACIDEGLYFIGWKGLRCYAVGQKPDGFRHRLTKESMSEVTKALRVPEKSFVETNLLWEYFKNTFVTLLSRGSIGE